MRPTYHLLDLCGTTYHPPHQASGRDSRAEDLRGAVRRAEGEARWGGVTSECTDCSWLLGWSKYANQGGPAPSNALTCLTPGLICFSSSQFYLGLGCITTPRTEFGGGEAGEGLCSQAACQMFPSSCCWWDKPLYLFWCLFAFPLLVPATAWEPNWGEVGI